MSYRYASHGLSVAAALAAVIVFIALALEAKGPKVPPLMAVAFADRPGDRIRSDGLTSMDEPVYYVDGRVVTDLFGQENAGVEAFRFGSGNLGLRLDASLLPRTVTLDFGPGPIANECFDDDNEPIECDPLPAGWDAEDGDDNDTFVIERAISELNNNPNILFGSCTGESKGGSGKGPKGLLCLESVGDEVTSRFPITWSEGGRQFGLWMESDSLNGSTDPIRITRVDPASDPRGEGNASWSFESTGMHRGRLTSIRRNGRDERDYGVFYMPFRLVTSCVEPDCS